MTFELTGRAAAGRLGRLRTQHGDVTTPTMMPVVNPNIDLVPAREMRERFGAEMVITNSYVMHKHDDLREAARAHGAHAMIDWDGALMTDSGTFQMYVYGDVDVAPDDIMRFQAEMGVDVATCLDLFVTPDMDRAQAEKAVATTLQRTRDAAILMRGRDAVPAGPVPGVAGGGAEGGVDDHRAEGDVADDALDPDSHTKINATVQGGTHLDLREACATAYRDLPVEYHTIGGVVPVMEQQMYPELVEMILASQRALRKDRPVHLFGAGHPLVFPLATALGCDLFDSSSYAKYAKDGRMMWEGGTLHVRDLDEWPVAAPMLMGWTPKELATALKAKAKKAPARVDSGDEPAPWARGAAARIKQREADDPRFAAERALALHNLDVCFTDLRRVRTALRDGTLWELVEQRATCHPMLAAATRRLREPHHQAWLEAREPLSGSLGISKAMRYTGALTHHRPMFHRIRERLTQRYSAVGEPVEAEIETPYADVGDQRLEAAMHKEASKPFSQHVDRRVDPAQDHVVINALGPTPIGLDEAYPFAQSFLPPLDGLDRGHMGWVGETKDAFLQAHGMMPAIPGPPGPRTDAPAGGGVAVPTDGNDAGAREVGQPGADGVARRAVCAADGGLDLDFLQVLRTADWQFGAGAGTALLDGDLRVDRSRKTGKMRTVHVDGEHVLSLRAEDGLFTLKVAGARRLHAALAAPALRVVVADDSVAFNREGRSVFAGFVTACDVGLRPGDECLVVDANDHLVAIGRVLLNAEEMADFQTGIAVKVREGTQAEGGLGGAGPSRP